MSVTAHAADLCRWWVLIALLVAAFGKTTAFGRFRDELAISFPEFGKAAAPLAVLIVVVEWALALLMLRGGAVGRFALIGAAVVFAALTGVVAVALLQDRIVVCRCFGGTPHPMSAYDLLRNGLLVGAALVAAFVPLSSGTGVPGQFALACIAFMLLRLSASLQDIVAVLRIKA
jgi:hypothetical protein